MSCKEPLVEDTAKCLEERLNRIAITKKKIPGRNELLGDSAPLPVSTDFYRGRVPSMVLHKDLQNTLILKEVQNNPNFRTGVPIDQIANRSVPRSSKEMTLNFTREEKLLLYDYCVRATAAQQIAAGGEELHLSAMNLDSSFSSMAETPSPTLEEDLQFVTLSRGQLENIPSTSGSGRGSYTAELRRIIQREMAAWEEQLRRKGRRVGKRKELKRLQK